VTAICGLSLPRLEQEYLAGFSHGMSIASAQRPWIAAPSGGFSLEVVKPR
jgi:hypothetical protein